MESLCPPSKLPCLALHRAACILSQAVILQAAQAVPAALLFQLHCLLEQYSAKTLEYTQWPCSLSAAGAYESVAISHLDAKLCHMLDKVGAAGFQKHWHLQIVGCTHDWLGVISVEAYTAAI